MRFYTVENKYKNINLDQIAGMYSRFLESTGVEDSPRVRRRYMEAVALFTGEVNPPKVLGVYYGKRNYVGDLCTAVDEIHDGEVLAVVGTTHRTLMEYWHHVASELGQAPVVDIGGVRARVVVDRTSRSGLSLEEV